MTTGRFDPLNTIHCCRRPLGPLPLFEQPSYRTECTSTLIPSASSMFRLRLARGLENLTVPRENVLRISTVVYIGVDLTGLLGDAWPAPKVGRCRVWWGWGGVSPLEPTKGSGERRELPQWGPGQSPGRKRILAYF